MRVLNDRQLQALFRNQTGDLWVGGIHMMNKFYEYVPFSLDGKQHVMAFYLPQDHHGQSRDSDGVLLAKDGGEFIPKRDHRVLKLFTLEDTQQQKTTPLPLMEEVQVSMTEPLRQVLYQVLLTYYQQTPNANQFIYEATPQLGQFIANEMPDLAVKTGLVIQWHDELAAPFYGFTLFQNFTL